ncbi:FkbM family methyltransferase [Mucilaginibacter sp. L3T2-6]|uniref:FkbM family methyltransferase n=1 Tax=Mucilaginibacter sp. L3T2-6 TaxID=3062491 RepID=UPI0026755E67|nr:FkbM family methyltransferase [Mucilaginibacter sp. L3T2-6]MDO3643066.1 FkbM family methyltransferase [Mucilaginibacter sp. L3T2-6]MDV6215833.1 FkbM family methyltransferase [Mucilaginibacter sp. L3T2-6]
MKRIDRIKLDFTRNWKLPGKERLSNLLRPSDKLKSGIKNGIAWLTGENIAIYANADSYIEWTILSLGTYEEEINKLIRISLKDGDNALDIGANIGLQSLRMSQCVGQSGNVIAFEPLYYLQEKFRRNIILNRANNVTLLPFALSDIDSEDEFPISTNNWNQGTFSLGSAATGTEKQHVIIKAGDNISEIRSFKSIALIKIDVEGFEYKVLLGLKHTIERHKPHVIFEYDENYWINNGQNIGDCYQFLQSLGYTFYQVTSVGCELITSVQQIEGGNLFCIPS